MALFFFWIGRGFKPHAFLFSFLVDKGVDTATAIAGSVAGAGVSGAANGLPVSVVIESIEAPTTGVGVGPFEFKRKKTIVTLNVIINGVSYLGTGQSNTDVKSTFIELQDENLPFEKSAFSAGLKKALQDAISKY